MFIPWTADFDSNALSSERPFQILPMGINFVLLYSTTVSAHNLETDAVSRASLLKKKKQKKKQTLFELYLFCEYHFRLL